MKTPLLLLVIAFFGYAAAQGGAICGDLTAPAVRTLTFCSMYSGGPTCCSETADADLGSNFTARVAPLYGTANCATNLKNLLCAVACAPNQIQFIKPQATTPVSVEVYVAPQTATEIYESCKGRCIPGLTFAPTMTVEQLFGAKVPQSFLHGLDSSSDPTYPPNYVRFTYLAGTNPNSNSYYNGSVLAASAEDQAGCVGARCFGTPGGPTARNLNFCTEYASSGCCTEEIEANLKGNFTKVRAILGTDGCSDNIRKLFCSWTCAPNQYDFISFMRGYDDVKAVLNVTVNPNFAAGMFNSCSSHCFDDKTGSRLTVGERFATGAPASILYFFGSASDPSYQANTDTLPIVTYQIGANGFQPSTISAASGADLTGCATATGDASTTGAASSLVFPFVAIFFAAALLLALIA